MAQTSSNKSEMNISSNRSITDEGLGIKKSMFVVIIVIGCFAVLWPRIFYPMLVNNANNIHPGPNDIGCCGVISAIDVDTIQIMSELCGSFIDPTKTHKEIFTKCTKTVYEKCGIDISAALKDRISLGHSTMQILDDVRSLNGSLCLKYHFGLSPNKLGIPHQRNMDNNLLFSVRQERPAHRVAGIHPAFRERGRAIPEIKPESTNLLNNNKNNRPKSVKQPVKIIEGRPGPIPGMRPTLGGPGHVLTPKSGGTSNFLMPLYTGVFIIFFFYVILKLVFKKKPQPLYEGFPLYPPCQTEDEQFHQEVFDQTTLSSSNDRHLSSNGNNRHQSGDKSKIVLGRAEGEKYQKNDDVDEINQLRRRLRESELAMERILQEMSKAPLVQQQNDLKPNGNLTTTTKNKNDEAIEIMGMETTASAENGKKWSRPDSPELLPTHHHQQKETSPSLIPTQQIFLETSLSPNKSQILVADSATEAAGNVEDDADSPVVLAGKMTLSVISLDSENSSDSGSNTNNNNNNNKGINPDDERRTSSSNVSEEFEKITATDLLLEEEQQIIEESEDFDADNENVANNNSDDEAEAAAESANFTTMNNNNRRIFGEPSIEDILRDELNREIIPPSGEEIVENDDVDEDIDEIIEYVENSDEEGEEEEEVIEINEN